MKRDARADYLAVHPQELAIQNEMVRQIIYRIQNFKKEVTVLNPDFIRSVNDAIGIGGLVTDLLDLLPGKQMTLDFWKHFEPQLKLKEGQITRRQLKWFVRIARQNLVKVTDENVGKSWRKQLLAAAGNEIVGKRPGVVAHNTNYYNLLFHVLDHKKLASICKGLERNPSFGKFADWTAERKQRAWLQLEPFYKIADEIRKELKPV